jgi:1,4-alpha-glucan branching enzyme
MYAHPGKKLLFMGSEFGQWREWNHDRSLDWHLLTDPAHLGIRRLVQDLNWHLAAEPALHEVDFTPEGFRWIDCNDSDHSVVSLIRYGLSPEDFLVMIFNFTPVPRETWRVGVPEPGRYHEFLNTDSDLYGGSNLGNSGAVDSEPVAANGLNHSLLLTVPPLGALYLKRRG